MKKQPPPPTAERTEAGRIQLSPLQVTRLKTFTQTIARNGASNKAFRSEPKAHFFGLRLPDGTMGKDPAELQVGGEDARGAALVTTSFDENSISLASEAERGAYNLFKVAMAVVPKFNKTSAKLPREVPPFVPTLKQQPSPIPYDGHEPPLDFGGREFLGKSALRPTDLKNGLITGETGSGKSVSAVIPILEAFLKYQVDGRSTSMLVVDPKFELLQRVTETLAKQGQSERLVLIGKCPALKYFNDNGQTVRERFYKCKELVPAANDSYQQRWQAFSDSLVIEVLELDQLYLDRTGMPLLESLFSIACMKSCQHFGQWRALQEILDIGMAGLGQLKLLHDALALLLTFADMTDEVNPFVRYIGQSDSDQFYFNARTAKLITEAMGSPEIEQVVDFDTRFYRDGDERIHTDIQEAVNTGKVVVYQPANSHAHDVAARALKTLYFAGSLERSGENMCRSVAIVCDEAHRFLTYGRQTGEANMLSTCRGFRVNYVLATQAISSIRIALGESSLGAAEVQSILENTTSKWAFRTSDPTTAERLIHFIPKHPSNGQHILEARPLSTLETGESYFVCGNRYGRSKYRMDSTTQASGTSHE